MSSVAEYIQDLTAQRTSSAVEDPGPASDIVACGTLPWRCERGALEVLLIHRPRYDDWSWPKGKLDEEETLPECAIRETREEINLDVELGIPLPIIRYQVEGKSKEVWYWAAEVTTQQPRADQSEVDRVEWLSVEQARQRLTNDNDHQPLDALVEAFETKTLRTRPCLFLRHAKAKPRSSWSRAESERPLAATGRRQAWTVKRLLEAWSPQRVISSPWVRCMQTVAPFTKQAKRNVKQRDILTEKQAGKKASKATKEFLAQLGKNRPRVICTHRPVFPRIFEAIKAHLKKYVESKDLRDRLLNALPTDNPYVSPGAVIVVHQAVDRQLRIVSVEIYDSYDL
ncbi:NUDIX hydrolase [Auritidibacter sp. NML100628]|uniref:NUDIX hydrolase n=1 Tax=Auritidibacter sp. NML100628 TaxID=2170742 RepID=UPI001F312427|nr:NUDIX hydrolase [Auritidibacter sp. NML100628]